MNMSTKQELFESILEQVVETLGDITQPVMTAYYKKFPEARASFAEHGLDNIARLEASMIETVVYTLMTWFERPDEIEITLSSTVPHHMNILNIPMNILYGLVDSTLDIIENVISDNEVQITLCKNLRQEIKNCIRESV
jgi:hypothetical protein